MPVPAGIQRLQSEAPALQGRLRGRTEDERKRIEREIRERERIALQELGGAWLACAFKPQDAAFAKRALFLGNVYVVSAAGADAAAQSGSHVQQRP